MPSKNNKNTRKSGAKKSVSRAALRSHKPQAHAHKQAPARSGKATKNHPVKIKMPSKAAEHGEAAGNANVKQAEEARKNEELVGNNALVKAINSNIGHGAMDVLKLLAPGPKTDESIAEKLGVKVNDVRRILNAMNSHSIVRYDVNKDTKGWLIFTWRIDSEKLSEYVAETMHKKDDADSMLPGNCNDFFICKGCYQKERTVLPFDSAFEYGFVCISCRKPFTPLSREETVALFKTAN